MKTIVVARSVLRQYSTVHRLYVVVNMGLLLETFPAVIATERFFACVRQHVLVEGRFRNASKITMVALLQGFSGMDLLVDPHC